jgi:hypothetical protein
MSEISAELPRTPDHGRHSTPCTVIDKEFAFPIFETVLLNLLTNASASAVVT